MRRDLVIPPKLRRGDRVAVLSPSWAAPAAFPAVQEQAMRRLRDETGLEPVEYPTTRRLGASPADRAADLMELAKATSLDHAREAAVRAQYRCDHQDAVRRAFATSHPSATWCSAWTSGTPIPVGAALRRPAHRRRACSAHRCALRA